MRLTQILLKHHPLFIGKIPKFRGSALKGKHKFVPPATKGVRYMKWLEWRDEEEVLKNISKPYVSAEQELDYLATQERKNHDVDPLYTSKIETPMQQRYAVQILEKFERSRQHEILE